MKNEIKSVEGNTISFTIYHEVDGKKYSPVNGEKYKMKVKRNLKDDTERALEFISDSASFDFDCVALTCGTYYFEIAIVDSNGIDTVISPAVDEHGNRLNTLIITERL